MVSDGFFQLAVGVNTVNTTLIQPLFSISEFLTINPAKLSCGAVKFVSIFEDAALTVPAVATTGLMADNNKGELIVSVDRELSIKVYLQVETIGGAKTIVPLNFTVS